MDNSALNSLAKLLKLLTLWLCGFFLSLKIEETIAFAKLVESTGIVALAVHGR